MGPGLYMANGVRPADAGASAGLTLLPAEKPAPEFDDYLSDARASQKTALEERPEPSDHPDDRPDEEVTEATTPQDWEGPIEGDSPRISEGAAGAPIATETVAPVVQTDLSPIVESVQVKEIPQGGAQQTRGVIPIEAEPVEARPQPAPGMTARSQAPVLAVNEEQGPIETPSVRPSKHTVDLERGQTSDSDQPTERRQPLTPNGRAGQTEASALRAGPTSVDPLLEQAERPVGTDRPAQAERPALPKTTEENGEPKAAQKATAKPEGRADEGRPLAADRETIHDLKVKDSIEGRRRGSADGQASREQKPSQGGVGGMERAPAAGRSRSGPQYVDAVAKLRAASIRASSGDSAAASVGWFLIAGAEGSAGSGGGLGGPVRLAASAFIHGGGANTGSASSVAGGSVSSMVGEILASEVSGPDGSAHAARVLNASGASGRFQVTLQLEPPELGQMRLQVQMQQQSMTLHVDVESQAVAKLIESRMSALRDALAVHGIRIERADVVVRSPASPDAGAQQREDGQGSGGAPGERTGDQPEDWVSDGGQTETALDHGSQESGAEGEQRDDLQDNLQDALAAESEATDTTRTAKLSLDLMA